MSNDDFGEIENEDLDKQSDHNDYDYEEDLMEGAEVVQTTEEKSKQRRQSTPYHKQTEQDQYIEYKYEDDEDLNEEINNHSLEDENQQLDEEVQDEDDEEQYEEDGYEPPEEEENQEDAQDYEEDPFEENIQDDKSLISKQTPIRKNKPAIPIIKSKPTYQELYQKDLQDVDYSKWQDKQLQAENKSLRLRLMEISEEVTKLVEKNKKPLPQIKEAKKVKTPRKIGTKVVIDAEIQTNKKKLEQQEIEISQLQFKIQSYERMEYFSKLEQDYIALDNRIIQINKEIKANQLSMKRKGKDLQMVEGQAAEKLIQESSQRRVELANAQRINQDLRERSIRLSENKDSLIDLLPNIELDLLRVQKEANSIGIDPSTEDALVKQFQIINAQKETLLKHHEIITKKINSFKHNHKELQQIKRSISDADQSINSLEKQLIGLRQEKEVLKAQLPSEALKMLIPASMTHENLSITLKQEQEAKDSRKLQSAKPSSKPPLVKYNPKSETKINHDKFENVENSQTLDQPLQPQNQTVDNQLQASPQIKSGGKLTGPFSTINQKAQVLSNIQTKPAVQEQAPPNQLPTVSEPQIIDEYSLKPTKMLRMRKPLQQQSELTYQIESESAPQQNKEIKIEEGKPVDLQELKIEESKDYQPTFKIQNRRNRLQQSIESQNIEPYTIQNNEVIEEPTMMKRNRRDQQILTDQQKPYSELIDQNDWQSQDRSKVIQSIQLPKEQINQEQAITNIDVLQSIQQNPKRQPQQGRNRNTNRLNIWDEQPSQQDNIFKIQEVKELKEIDRTQEKEMTLEEILSGGQQDRSEPGYRPNYQGRKFEVPQESSKQSVINEVKADPKARQRQLAQKAENENLFDDFDF